MASENNLTAVFTDIANAIRDKKGSVDTIKPINMADEILTIETKSTIYSALESMGTNWSYALYGYVYSSYANNNYSVFYYMTELKGSDIPPSSTNVLDMSNMLFNCKYLKNIPFFNTSSCTNMKNMLYGCSSLTTIPQLDTSSCTDAQDMFGDCEKLTTIPQLDFSSCKNMMELFVNCSKITYIPQLDTSSCTNMSSLVRNCKLLEKIDIKKFVSGTNNNSSFATNCYSLKILIIRTMDTIPDLNSNAFNNCYHFYGTTDATYNPNGLKDGRIYVPDDKVESLKTATNWSVFADIIKPLSEYTGE